MATTVAIAPPSIPQPSMAYVAACKKQHRQATPEEFAVELEESKPKPLLMTLKLALAAGLVGVIVWKWEAVLVASDAAAHWLFTPSDDEVCDDGVILPGPQKTGLNLLLYLAGLLWSFVGVAIVADLFMVGIEVITSQTVEKPITQADGSVETVTLTIWNATVANLTLMALGSSAPEILLSCIEIVTSDFFAGELGPSTIVGSAAFNLLVISAVCITAIPSGEGRLVKDLTVFSITAVASVFAYLWLLVILMVISPNVVEVWEGVATLIFFPILVGLAYLADTGYFRPKAPVSAGKVIDVSTGAGDIKNSIAQFISRDKAEWSKAKAGALVSLLQLPRSRAYYRVNTTRQLVGGKVAAPEKEATLTVAKMATAFAKPKPAVSHVHFLNAESRVASAGQVVLVFQRTGELGEAAEVTYSIDGGSFQNATVVFPPEESGVEVPIPTATEDFVARIESVSSASSTTAIGPNETCAFFLDSYRASLHAGTLAFEAKEVRVIESEPFAALTIARSGGHSGAISVRWRTADGTALAGQDYEGGEGTLDFGDGVTKLVLTVKLIDDGRYEADEQFTVELLDPTGGASLAGGESEVATVTIVDDGDRKALVDDVAAILKLDSAQVSLAASSWGEQFKDAVAYTGEVSPAGVYFYLLALPWKVLFAVVPPASFCGGWLCFSVALVMIGALTALIGDLADHMGCCMGLMPSVTAITFVALGTSLPDTFASKTAALNEPNADSSIGNITGSNSVNVFLGLGLPWALAAVYWSHLASEEAQAEWAARYTSEPWYEPGMKIAFAVPAGDLGFSVGVFSACACTCLGVLVLRRWALGFELGGPTATKYGSAVFFVLLWFAYISLSASKSYGVI